MFGACSHRYEQTDFEGGARWRRPRRVRPKIWERSPGPATL